MRPLLAALALLLVALFAAPASGAPEPGGEPAHGSAPALPNVASSSCFGAAARDPERRPCRDPRLRRVVVPRPAEARRLPNAPCDPVERTRDLNVCGFGVDPEDASETIALVGDSHASHWRAGLDVAAKARGWRGLSIAHTSCPLSKAVRNLEDPARFRSCAAWKRAVFAWFERHPEVTTVFVGGLSGGAGVIPPRGLGRFEASVRGYVGAWRALPPTVKRIVVIRDTPKMRKETGACVERALARGARAGSLCAMPRRAALDRDPMMAAAARMGRERVRTVDMTRWFCDRGPCYPVIGGALVLRDQNHMTAVYASSLGPYLLRAIDRALGSRRAAAATAARASASADRCFGARARDPGRRCDGAQRRVAVVPAPREARNLPPAPCRRNLIEGAVHPCMFGTPPELATSTFAVVGDSHAAHWRPALDAVAHGKRWHGLSIMVGGCPLSRALRALTPALRRANCAEWKRQVFAWFERHPEVETVFVSGLSGGSGVVPARGRTEFETSVSGYRAAWRALPASVKRIVVIRDTPKMRGDVDACVARAIAGRRPAARRCAVPRRLAVDRDPIWTAAKRSGSSRVRRVDLSRFFCDRRRCFPVIGGVLAFKDSTHLTPNFSATLGPYLLRAVSRALRR